MIYSRVKEDTMLRNQSPLPDGDGHFRFISSYFRFRHQSENYWFSVKVVDEILRISSTNLLLCTTICEDLSEGQEKDRLKIKSEMAMKKKDLKMDMINISFRKLW